MNRIYNIERYNEIEIENDYRNTIHIYFDVLLSN